MEENHTSIPIIILSIIIHRKGHNRLRLLAGTILTSCMIIRLWVQISSATRKMAQGLGFRVKPLKAEGLSTSYDICIYESMIGSQPANILA